MKWTDAIELTQMLARTCKLEGLLAQTWGSHSLSSEGVVSRGGAALSQYERDRKLDEYAQQRLPGMLAKAEPYFVDAGLCEVVQRMQATLPDATRLHPRLFKSNVGCLFFEKTIDMPPRRLQSEPGHPDFEPAPLSGFAWQCDPAGVVFVHIYAWSMDTSSPSWFKGVYIGNIPLAVTPWEYATSTLGLHIAAHNAAIFENPEELDTNNATRFAISARATVATLLLMDQVLTVVNTEAVDRASRKRAVKAGWTLDPTVQVVKLRRVDKVNLYEHGRDVEWHCRWQVQQHWRVLRRGTPAERTVLVHSYIKGPPDAPLKLPNPKVWAVVR